MNNIWVRSILIIFLIGLVLSACVPAPAESIMQEKPYELVQFLNGIQMEMELPLINGEALWEETYEPGLGWIMWDLVSTADSCELVIIFWFSKEISIKMSFSESGPCTVDLVMGWLDQFQTRLEDDGYNHDMIDNALKRIRTLVRLKISRTGR